MPIRFNLKQLKDDHQCDVYFETGFCRGESAKNALKCDFSKVYSVEIVQQFVLAGRRNIKDNRLTIIHDDSSNLDKYLSDINQKVLFFLDAHVDNKLSKTHKFKCPLVSEIEAISKMTRKDHVILIDDVRILKRKTPWGETTFKTDNILEELKEHILKINKNYKFKFLDGHVKDDVLCAFISA